jgi:hypothetical protein
MLNHPNHPDRAAEYLDEARAAYARAVARGEKQAQLRPRQRDLTEAWMHAILAGLPI